MISVVITCVNLNKINVHVKNLKIKIQPVHWFGLTELKKTMGIMLRRRVACELYRKYTDGEITRKECQNGSWTADIIYSP